MRIRITILICVILICTVGMAKAQDKIDPAFELIDPFLKENTYLLVHIDLKALDLDAAANKIKETALKSMAAPAGENASEDSKDSPPMPFGDPKAMVGMQIDAMVAPLRQVRKGMLDAGVEGLYFLAMMETMNTFPVVMAVSGEPSFDGDTNAFLAAAGFIKAGFADEMTFYVVNPGNPAFSPSTLMMGGSMGQAAPSAPKVSPESFMTVLRKAKAKYRPEINDALYLQRKSPIRVVLAPSAGIKGMLPMLLAMAQPAQQLDQNAMSSLVRDLESFSLGIDLATMRFNLAFCFPDEEKAEKAGNFFADLAAGVEDETARVLVHEFLPKPNKNRLILVLKEEHFEKLAAAGPMMPVAGVVEEGAGGAAETDGNSME